MDNLTMMFPTTRTSKNDVWKNIIKGAELRQHDGPSCGVDSVEVALYQDLGSRQTEFDQTSVPAPGSGIPLNF